MADIKPDTLLEIVEISRETGKIRKGVNEATKAIERGIAKVIIAAEDTDPPEILMHLEPLCDEKKIPFFKVPSRSELGRAAGLTVSCATIAVTDLGEAQKKFEQIVK